MTQASSQSRRFQDHAALYSAVDWFEALASPDVSGDRRACLPDYRERMFPPLETLSMFIAQAVSADGSCQQVVNEAVTDQLLSGASRASTATGGYCRARARLPIDLIQQLTRNTAEPINAPTPASGSLTERRVRVVDGTTLALPDTPDNQVRFPQPRTQRAGVGFPLCRLVAVFNLSDGAMGDAAIGGYRGKGAHEQRLLRELLDDFEPGDIMLGDAAYSEANRPPVPTDAGHPFRPMPATDSEASRPPCLAVHGPIRARSAPLTQGAERAAEKSVHAQDSRNSQTQGPGVVRPPDRGERRPGPQHYCRVSAACRGSRT